MRHHKPFHHYHRHHHHSQKYPHDRQRYYREAKEYYQKNIQEPVSHHQVTESKHQQHDYEQWDAEQRHSLQNTQNYDKYNPDHPLHMIDCDAHGWNVCKENVPETSQDKCNAHNDRCGSRDTLNQEMIQEIPPIQKEKQGDPYVFFGLAAICIILAIIAVIYKSTKNRPHR